MKEDIFAAYDGVCLFADLRTEWSYKDRTGNTAIFAAFLNCRCFYTPAPAVGFDSVEDCRNPYESDYLKSGPVTVGEYLNGRATT